MAGADGHPGVAPDGRWWGNHQQVNGVFKGGGARGAAYAGALRAVAERDTWFASVAGASAGAITAALIAAGLTPAEIESATPKGLASVKRGLAWAITGRTNALFANAGLADFLETLLVGKVRPGTGTGAGVPSSSRPVTFAELHRATGIGLYVLTMDLCSREPQIFHHRLTPDVSVASAVVASCAIPGAFPAGRAVIVDADTASVRELVDGGAWANFPWFVYRDQNFRAWLRPELGPAGGTAGAAGSPDAADRAADVADAAADRAADVADAAAEASRPTYGFVLDDELVRPRRHVHAVLDHRTSSRLSRRFDLGPAGTSGGVVPYLMSAVLGGDVLRLVLVAVVLLLGAVSLAATPVLARLLVQSFGRSTVAPFTPFLVFLLVALLLVVIGLVVVGAVAVLALGRVLADTVLPSAEAALGVATGVAPWVGAQASDSEDRVLTVPAIGLRTTTFTVPDELRRQVVQHAFERCQAQLAGTPSAALNALAGQPASRATRTILRQLLFRLARTLLVTVVALRLLVAAVSDLEAAHPARGIGWLAASVAGLVVIAGLTARRARFRAEHTVTRTAGDAVLQRRWGQALGAIGVICVVVSLVLVTTRFRHNENGVVNARIVAGAIAADGRHVYQFTGTVRRGAEAGTTETDTFVSTTDYRLGERLFVFRGTGERWDVARKLTLDAFALPLVLLLTGLGLARSGWRDLRWLHRDDRLAAMTGAPVVAAAATPAATAPL